MVVGRAGAMAFQHQKDASGSFPWRRGEVPKRVKLSTWEIVGSREVAADCMECKDAWGLWAAPRGMVRGAGVGPLSWILSRS